MTQGGGGQRMDNLPAPILRATERGRNDEDCGEHVPHALQILFPTSSRRHKGVVLVPQFAQLSAPTWLRTLDRLLAGVCALMTGDDSAPEVSAPCSTTGAVASAFCAGAPFAGSTTPAWRALL